MEVKPLLARVRSDGPLLGDLGRRLALHVASHYLAPPGLVVRAMLPPGTLERIALFAVRSRRPASWHGRGRRSARAGSPARPKAQASRRVGRRTGWRRCSRPPERPGCPSTTCLPHGSRATLLRELRQLEARGELRLEWRILAATARPRQERWAVITPAGREAAVALAAGGRPAGPPLGARQQALLAELTGAGHEGAEAAPRLGERHGPGTVTSLARRGLLKLETRTLERRAMAGRAAPVRGSRPAGSDLDAEQATALAAIRGAIDAGRHEAFLLEGETASGKTAVYAEAIAAALATGRGALVLVPGDRPRGAAHRPAPPRPG